MFWTGQHDRVFAVSASLAMPGKKLIGSILVSKKKKENFLIMGSFWIGLLTYALAGPLICVTIHHQLIITLVVATPNISQYQLSDNKIARLFHQWHVRQNGTNKTRPLSRFGRPCSRVHTRKNATHMRITPTRLVHDSAVSRHPDQLFDPFLAWPCHVRLIQIGEKRRVGTSRKNVIDDFAWKFQINLQDRGRRRQAWLECGLAS